MDLDEVDSAPFDSSQFLLGCDVRDIPVLDHLAHRDDRALDWEVLETYQVLLAFDQSSDFANALACGLGAIGQDTLLFVSDTLDTVCTKLLLRVSGIATSARVHHAVLLAQLQTLVDWNHLSCSNAGFVGLWS